MNENSVQKHWPCTMSNLFHSPKSALSWMHYGKIWCSQKAILPTSALSSWDSQALRLTSVQYETFPPHGWDVREMEGTGDGVKLHMRRYEKYTTQQCARFNKKEMQTIYYAIKADLSMHILTINVIRSKVDLNIESFISIFDCWQGEVRRGFLGKIWHHSLWKKTTRKRIAL